MLHEWCWWVTVAIDETVIMRCLDGVIYAMGCLERGLVQLMYPM